jgi:hypothetical protein
MKIPKSLADEIEEMELWRAAEMAGSCLEEFKETSGL